jgi:Fe-S-cluster containining protein
VKAYVLGGRPIHLPFLSGLLRYGCAECDAPCCKGASLAVGRSRELVSLQRVQPNLPLFAAPGFAGSPLLSIQSPKDACWFYDDKKNRCRVEAVMGRDAKPAGCRLFPFHRIRGAGESLVILPDFTCPIVVGDETLDEGQFSHDEIVLEMHRTHIPVRGHPTLPPPKDLAWDKAIRLERRVVRASERFLDRDRYLPFAEHQLERTCEILGTKPHVELSNLDRHIREVLGIPMTSSPITVRHMVALTGVLRVMVSPLARKEMPALLLALAALVDAYVSMRGATFSTRTITSLFEVRLPFLYTLAHLDDVPLFDERVDSIAVFDGFPFVRSSLITVAESIVANRTRRSKKILGEILGDTGFTSPLGFDEVAMLFALGRVLLQHGTFVPETRAPARPRSARTDKRT